MSDPGYNRGIFGKVIRDLNKGTFVAAPRPQRSYGSHRSYRSYRSYRTNSTDDEEREGVRSFSLQTEFRGVSITGDFDDLLPKRLHMDRCALELLSILKRNAEYLTQSHSEMLRLVS